MFLVQVSKQNHSLVPQFKVLKCLFCNIESRELVNSWFRHAQSSPLHMKRYPLMQPVWDHGYVWSSAELTWYHWLRCKPPSLTKYNYILLVLLSYLPPTKRAQGVLVDQILKIRSFTRKDWEHWTLLPAGMFGMLSVGHIEWMCWRNDRDRPGDVTWKSLHSLK